MVTLTLDHMARGGIYDQLGGGFHRYSTERTWTVPHFEKMLYDNAQLVEVYARAYRGDEEAAVPAGRAGDAGLRRPRDDLPEGAFYSALDADSDGEEGRFYVWTDKEIDAVLTDKADADLVKKVYGADGEPNFEEKYHILRAARRCRMRRPKKRAGRRCARSCSRPAPSGVRPFLDTKVLTAWNGQMIAGYAVAGQMLDEPKYTAAAAQGRRLRADEAAHQGRPAAAHLRRASRAAAEAQAQRLPRRLRLSRSRPALPARRHRGQEVAGRGEGADRHDGASTTPTTRAAGSSTRRTITRSCLRAARTSTTAPSRRATAWRPATWCGCG